MLKVSVAMTTYNGEKYIQDQLKSILAQSRQPNEVIICDDGSSDSTIKIVADFIENNGLKEVWKVFINSKNKGYNRNFIECANMTTGDIIFFSDQDDIWHEKKIEYMTNAFINNSDMKALSCRLSVIDSNNKPNNKMFNRLRMGNGKLEKINLPKQIRNNMSGGLTLAVKREVLELMGSKILSENLPYDLTMGLFTSVFDGYYILWKPLVYYRVHNNNVSQPHYSLRARLNNPEYHIRGRELRLELMKSCLSMIEILNNNIQERDKLNIANAIKLLESDIIYLRERKTLSLIKNLFVSNPMVNKQISLFNIIISIFGSDINTKNKFNGETK